MLGRRSICRGGWAALLVLLSAAGADAGEAYYLIVFASQRGPNTPSHNHTFATFVRATWDDGCASAPRVEAHAISWLPCDMRIRAFALLPEPGRNFDLHTTLRHVLADGQTVTMWGPYQIEAELYRLALAEIGRLEGGCLRYKSFDAGYRSDRVTNCSHAVRSTVLGPRRLLPVIGGQVSSLTSLRVLSPWVTEPGRVHPWVASALGLDEYPIARRAP